MDCCLIVEVVVLNHSCTLLVVICVWNLHLVLMFGSNAWYSCTCTFLRASRLLAMHPKLASKILLPEFCEPDVPAVVGERAAPEVAIERWRGGKGKNIRMIYRTRDKTRTGRHGSHGHTKHPCYGSWKHWPMTSPIVLLLWKDSNHSCCKPRSCRLALKINVLVEVILSLLSPQGIIKENNFLIMTAISAKSVICLCKYHSHFYLESSISWRDRTAVEWKRLIWGRTGWGIIAGFRPFDLRVLLVLLPYLWHNNSMLYLRNIYSNIFSNLLSRQKSSVNFA